MILLLLFWGVAVAVLVVAVDVVVAFFPCCSLFLVGVFTAIQKSATKGNTTTFDLVVLFFFLVAVCRFRW